MCSLWSFTLLLSSNNTQLKCLVAHPTQEQREGGPVIWWRLETPLPHCSHWISQGLLTPLCGIWRMSLKNHITMISMVPSGALILWASNSHPRCKLLSLSTIDILGCIILHCGAILCIVGGLTATLPSNHCMPAVSLVVMTKNVTIHFHMSPGGQNSLPPPWEPQY